MCRSAGVQLPRELLFFRLWMIDAKPPDRGVFLENVYNAPGSESRKRQFGERDKRAVLIHCFGEEATRLGQKRRSAACGLGVLRKTPLAQRTEEHLLGNFALKVERKV